MSNGKGGTDVATAAAGDTSAAGTTVTNSNKSPKKQHEKKGDEKQKEFVLKPPRKPLSAYNFFFQEERAKLLGSEIIDEEHPDPKDRHKRRHRKRHGKIGFTELAKHVGTKWKALSKEEKSEYTKKFEADKIRYADELAKYEERLTDMINLVQVKQALKQQKKQQQQLRQQEEEEEKGAEVNRLGTPESPKPSQISSSSSSPLAGTSSPVRKRKQQQQQQHPIIPAQASASAAGSNCFESILTTAIQMSNFPLEQRAHEVNKSRLGGQVSSKKSRLGNDENDEDDESSPPESSAASSASGAVASLEEEEDLLIQHHQFRRASTGHINSRSSPTHSINPNGVGGAKDDTAAAAAAAAAAHKEAWIEEQLRKSRAAAAAGSSCPPHHGMVNSLFSPFSQQQHQFNMNPHFQPQQQHNNMMMMKQQAQQHQPHHQRMMMMMNNQHHPMAQQQQQQKQHSFSNNFPIQSQAFMNNSNEGNAMMMMMNERSNASRDILKKMQMNFLHPSSTDHSLHPGMNMNMVNNGAHSPVRFENESSEGAGTTPTSPTPVRPFGEHFTTNGFSSTSRVVSTDACTDNDHDVSHNDLNVDNDNDSTTSDDDDYDVIVTDVLDDEEEDQEDTLTAPAAASNCNSKTKKHSKKNKGEETATDIKNNDLSLAEEEDGEEEDDDDADNDHVDHERMMAEITRQQEELERLKKQLLSKSKAKRHSMGNTATTGNSKRNCTKKTSLFEAQLQHRKSAPSSFAERRSSGSTGTTYGTDHDDDEPFSKNNTTIDIRPLDVKTIVTAVNDPFSSSFPNDGENVVDDDNSTVDMSDDDRDIAEAALNGGDDFPNHLKQMEVEADDGFERMLQGMHHLDDNEEDQGEKLVDEDLPKQLKHSFLTDDEQNQENEDQDDTKASSDAALMVAQDLLSKFGNGDDDDDDIPDNGDLLFPFSASVAGSSALGDQSASSDNLNFLQEFIYG